MNDLREISNRADDVANIYGEYASLHEAFSVLLEEVGELGQEIYAKERCIGRIRAEATDCAVVCLRILREWPLTRDGVIEGVRVINMGFAAADIVRQGTAYPGGVV